MKTKLSKAVSAYRLLNGAKLSKMNPDEQIALVRNLRPLRKVYEDYDSFIKESVKKLAPEGWDGMQEILAGVDALEGEELAARLADPEVFAAMDARNGYSGKIMKLDQEESAKETELDITPMTDEALGRLFAGNELTASQMLEIADILGR